MSPGTSRPRLQDNSGYQRSYIAARLRNAADFPELVQEGFVG
jgi:hypothetical protein